MYLFVYVWKGLCASVCVWRAMDCFQESFFFPPCGSWACDWSDQVGGRVGAYWAILLALTSSF